MRRSSPTASRRAMSGGASCMVEQLGLAMMPSCSPASPGLTSTTTSGTAGSMRHCEELSMTSAPRRAASGARTAETDAPAEKRGMSTRRGSPRAWPRTRPPRPRRRRPHARPRARPADGARPRGSRARRGPGSSSARRRRGGRRPRRGALHGGLAREVDAPLAIDLGDDDHDLVADGHDVLDARHVVVGEFADAHEALLARQDLDESAAAHDPGHLAQVERTDLDLARQALDPLDRLARVLAGDGRDLDRAVVLDVDLGAGLFLDLADHRAALADNLADLLGVDLDGDDARREVAHGGAGLGEHLGHLVEDGEARRVGLLQAVADDRLGDALDLDVHLQGRDAVARAGHLEVHVPEGVFLAQDVGEAIDVDPLEVTHSLTRRMT